MISVSRRLLNMLCIIAVLLASGACSSSDWRTASRESSGLAPRPETLNEAIFQIYTARAWSWRKYVATHPWIAWKRRQDAQYTIAYVAGWQVRRGLSAVVVQQDIPDRLWYGNQPEIIYSITGAAADSIIDRVDALIDSYPYHDTYRLWPGPNSNTFVEHIIRNEPALSVELPPNAIGKDYLTDSYIFATSPGGKGLQISLFGLLGMTAGLSEGLELNLLSMTFGVDIMRPALKLPFIGRLGMKDAPL
jgi:hypothetical protein